MAKAKYLCKRSFDDGSKRGVDGKSVSYKIGEEYQGADVKGMLEKGLICTEKEFNVEKEVLDEKDKVIRSLEKKIEELSSALKEQVAISEQLQKELDSIEVIDEE